MSGLIEFIEITSKIRNQQEGNEGLRQVENWKVWVAFGDSVLKNRVFSMGTWYKTEY